MDSLNAILKVRSLAKATDDREFRELHARLCMSEWRTIIDEFRLVDGIIRGKARLVRKDSLDFIRLADGKCR